jgi:TnpA family transposase
MEIALERSMSTSMRFARSVVIVGVDGENIQQPPDFFCLLRTYSRQNRLASALTELGKLERTSFLLDYFQDETLRRRILIGLNKGEALHALARQLFSGKHGNCGIEHLKTRCTVQVVSRRRS